MEESVTETEAHQSFRSPPRRRRSTFFERRDSLGPPTVSENVDPNPGKSNEADEADKKKLFNYYDKLLSEKEQWKKEVKSRRNIYHDLRQQYQMAVKSTSKSKMSYAVLSNEDIEFIKAKHNISKLVDNQKKLHEDVKLTQALYRTTCELDNGIINNCENRIKQITEYIFENSTVEPME